MRVEDYPCSTCWLHAQEWCSVCDPDTWVEDLEANDWLLEKGGEDFTATSPPAGRDGDTGRPGAQGELEAGAPVAQLFDTAPSFDDLCPRRP